MPAKQKKFLRLPFLLLPVCALVVLAVSSFLWYRAYRPPPPVPPAVQGVRTLEPAVFSAAVPDILSSFAAHSGLDADNVTSRPPDVESGIRTVYTVNIPPDASLVLYNTRLTEAILGSGGEILQALENERGTSVTLTVGSRANATDIIILRKSPRVTAARYRMAIIVDDCGIRDMESARRFCDLDAVVTLAILPFQRHTRDVVELARRTDTPYILHMPMEPLSEGVNPGEGALYVGDPREVVHDKLDRAFDSVGGAVALNNHMGSKVTTDPITVEFLMEYLKEHRYQFIDSQTSRESVAFAASREAAIKGAKITGYLDVDSDPAAIESRLDFMAEQAKTHGSALAICHDRPATLEVLERKLPELQRQDITFIEAAELLK